MSVLVLAPLRVFESQGFRWRTRVRDALLCEDGTLVSLHEDGAIVRWDLASGVVLEVLERVEQPFSPSLLLSERLVFARIFTGEIALLELRTGSVVTRMRCEDHWGQRERRNANGTVVGRSFVLFAQRERFERRAFRWDEFRLSCDGAWMVSWNNGSTTVDLYNVLDGDLVATQEFPSGVYDVVFSSDGGLLFVLCFKRLECRKLEQVGARASFGGMEWSTETAGFGDVLQLLEERDELYLFLLNKLLMEVRSAKDGSLLRTFRAPANLLLCSRDGRTAVFGGGTPFLRGDLVAGTVEDVRDAESGEIFSIDVSSSGCYVLWTNEEGVVVADVASGDVLAVMSGVGTCSNAIFLREESKIATGDGVFFWRTSEQCVVFDAELSGVVGALRCSEDGEFVLVLWQRSGLENSLGLFRSSDGTLLWETECGLTTAADFVDEHTIVSITDEGEVLRSFATGAILAHKSVQRSKVSALDRSLVFRGDYAFDSSKGPTLQLRAEHPGQMKTRWSCILDGTAVGNYYDAVVCGAWAFVWSIEQGQGVLLHNGNVVGEVQLGSRKRVVSAVFSLPLQSLVVGTAMGDVYRYELAMSERGAESTNAHGGVSK